MLQWCEHERGRREICQEVLIVNIRRVRFFPYIDFRKVKFRFKR